MKQTIYDKFLEICGCECSDEYRELLIRSCHRWNVSEEELHDACENLIPKRYHIELHGVRKLLGIYVNEWIRLEELWDSDEIKIYFNVPGSVGGMLWLKELLAHPAYLGSPDFISMVVLYGIIGKKEKIDCHSCRHCAVNMMRLKQWEERLVPKADIRFSYGCLCDEAPQMDQILKMEEQCENQYFIVRPKKNGEEIQYLQRQFEDAFKDLRNKFKMKDDLETYRVQKKKRFLLAVRVEQILQKLKKENCFLIGNAEIALLESLLLTTFRGGMDAMNKVATEVFHDMETICKEKRQQECIKIDKKFAVYYTPVCNAEYSRIFEENHIALLYHTAFKCKGIVSRDIDCYNDMARECLEMLIAGNAKEEAIAICKMLEEKQLDGLVLGMFTFDRWLGAKQNIIKDTIEKETGKRVFVYETDFWNQEMFAADRFQIAVETLRGIGDNLCELL